MSNEDAVINLISALEGQVTSSMESMSPLGTPDRTYEIGAEDESGSLLNYYGQTPIRNVFIQAPDPGIAYLKLRDYIYNSEGVDILYRAIESLIQRNILDPETLKGIILEGIVTNTDLYLEEAEFPLNVL